VPAEAPAFLRLAHHASQRLRNQLVAEADTDHRHLLFVRGTHEIFQRCDPVEVVIDAGRGTGDEDRLEPVDVRERLADGDADRIERHRAVGRADHLLEHLRIRSVTFAIPGADEAGFDDGDVWHRQSSLPL